MYNDDVKVLVYAKNNKESSHYDWFCLGTIKWKETVKLSQSLCLYFFNQMQLPIGIYDVVENIQCLYKFSNIDENSFKMNNSMISTTYVWFNLFVIIICHHFYYYKEAVLFNKYLNAIS